MATMSVAEQVQHLKALGLPHSTAARRKASWKIYQLGSAWYAFQPGHVQLEIDGVPGDVTSANVRYAATRGYRLSPNFSLGEFRCTCGAMQVDRVLLVALEKVRSRLYPGGLQIVSGYRCSARNRAVGGTPTSAHLRGQAADIPARHKPSAFTGLGLKGIGFKAGHGLVTHVDVAPELRTDHVFKEA